MRAVDKKPFDQWYQLFDGVDNRTLDLAGLDACVKAVDGVGEVYNLAADMGGMGFIENNRALCMLSVLINTHLLLAARDGGRPLLFRVVGVRLRGGQADLARRGAAHRGRRVPGHARGRLRLGEAFQRADVPPLRRGLRH